MTVIEATGLVPASVEAVFAFLSVLENHWTVAGRWVQLIGLDPDSEGGRVRIHGPMGMRRTVTTRVHATDPPRSIRGSATLGVTRTEVSWTLLARGAASTEVRLTAVVVRAGRLDRGLLRMGGARWMRRLFTVTIGRLAVAVPAHACVHEEPALSSSRA